jgi:hypothetical protein
LSHVAHPALFHFFFMQAYRPPTVQLLTLAMMFLSFTYPLSVFETPFIERYLFSLCFEATARTHTHELERGWIC